jgi:hypothetical protein
MATIEVDLDATSTSRGPLLGDRHVPVGSSNQRAGFAAGIPQMVPSEQLYFWTDEWQRGEQEAEEELRHGQGRQFDTSREAIMWLLSADDE